MDEDKVPGLEVVVLDGLLVVLLELLDRGEPTCQNFVMDSGEVFRLLLQLMGTSGDELHCREGLSEVWNKEGSESEIKWKDGFHAMCHIKGGEAS